jgi:hypothetical protein
MATKTIVCPECGATVAPGRYACAECGALLAAVGMLPRTWEPAETPAPTAPTAEVFEPPLGSGDVLPSVATVPATGGNGAPKRPRRVKPSKTDDAAAAAPPAAALADAEAPTPEAAAYQARLARVRAPIEPAPPLDPAADLPPSTVPPAVPAASGVPAASAVPPRDAAPTAAPARTTPAGRSAAASASTAAAPPAPQTPPAAAAPSLWTTAPEPPATPPAVIAAAPAPPGEPSAPAEAPVPHRTAAWPPPGALPPLPEPPVRTPAGAYLAPSAVLPPLDAPLPSRNGHGPGAAAHASDSAASASPRPTLTQSLEALGITADMPRKLVGAGAAVAVLGFLLPWISSIDTGAGFLDDYLDYWGLAGPGHWIVALALLVLVGFAFAEGPFAKFRIGAIAVMTGALLLGLLWTYLFGVATKSVGVWIVLAGASLIAIGGLVDLRRRHAEEPSAV